MIDWLKSKALMLVGFAALLALAAAGAQTVRLQIRDAELAAANAAVTKLTDERDRAQSELASYTETVARNIELLDDVNAAMRQATIEAQQARQMFGRHNFDDLLQKKPGLIEAKARAATVKIWEAIERDSQQF